MQHFRALASRGPRREGRNRVGKGDTEVREVPQPMLTDLTHEAYHNKKQPQPGVTRTATMADLLRDSPNVRGPQIFEPSKLKDMGFVSSSNGAPSIYFSSSETKQLADNMGHAIVGKFSHSIPTSNQIQKALDNMKFTRGFTWKHINAKHILIQLDDLVDYARLLNGPKDVPVWYINGHPMRVFKWSPDFDVFCKSPIAAMWCNLIGLPIHLYNHSALFAIG